jgi:hypothetical protein
MVRSLRSSRGRSCRAIPDPGCHGTAGGDIRPGRGGGVLAAHRCEKAWCFLLPSLSGLPTMSGRGWRCGSNGPDRRWGGGLAKSRAYGECLSSCCMCPSRSLDGCVLGKDVMLHATPFPQAHSAVTVPPGRPTGRYSVWIIAATPGDRFYALGVKFEYSLTACAIIATLLR